MAARAGSYMRAVGSRADGPLTPRPSFPQFWGQEGAIAGGLRAGSEQGEIGTPDVVWVDFR
jgi:hypothetical protein